MIAAGVMLGCLLSCLVQAEAPRRHPSGLSRGTVYQWRTQDGLKYQYHISPYWQPGKPINLTVILHGTDVDNRWGFLVFPPDRFRSDDVLLCPDGSSPAVVGNRNFHNTKEDLERLKLLIHEFKTLFPVRQTFLYGHSRGAFFALKFAGEYPDEVDGLCLEGGGYWSDTRMRKESHHQAIGILHGTGDFQVPYRQSLELAAALHNAKFPLLRVRPVQGAGHEPQIGEVRQILNWCEGMTTKESRRAVQVLTKLQRRAESTGDFSSAYAVARRILDTKKNGMSELQPADRAMVETYLERIQAANAAHIEAIEDAMREKSRSSPGIWTGHLLRYLVGFEGVPAPKKPSWNRILARHLNSKVSRAVEAFWKGRVDQVERAFQGGLQAVAQGYLHPEVPAIIPYLKRWMDSPEAHGIPRHLQRQYHQAIPTLETAIQAGSARFENIHRESRNPED